MMNFRVETFLNELNSELKEAILPYWMTRMVDQETGGFYGRIDGHDQLHPGSPKGSVLNARILWTFSAAYNYYKDPNYLEVAERAYDYCVRHFINHDNQGVFWKLDHKGSPLESKNQIYALAFMIYGLSEYYLSSGDERAIKLCQMLFRSIEQHSYDPDHGGYFEAFDEHWHLLEDLRLSEKDANEKKSMNTHLHILEGYTNLYNIWKDENLCQQIKNLIRIFTDKIVDPLNHHFRLFFDTDWKPKDDQISFGHDIEGSWLIQEAANVIGEDTMIAETRQLSIHMVKAVLLSGYDVDHGLIYEIKPGGHIDDDKHWWPQAEAMVGLVNAYQLSHDPAYLDLAMNVWDFIKAKIIDKNGGEWFFRVNQKGVPYLEEDKAGFWKCPYHNSRACLEILKRLS